MKYALIGCGRIAKHHINAAKECGLEIVALCDLQKEKAQRYISEFELPQSTHIYTDYQEMIKKLDIDLISIATESDAHAPIAINLIKNKINVIIEKPIALSLVDAHQIMELADKHAVKVCVCHQNRFNPAVQNMRNALEEGRFGKLTHGSVHIRWNRGANYYARGDWRGTWKQDGGALMNQCIHGIDMLLWMIGSDIVSVYGVIRRVNHDYIESEDLGMALIQFANGTIVTIEGTTNTYIEAEEACLCLYGICGAVKLGGATINNIEEWQFAEKVPTDKNMLVKETVKNVYGNSHPRIFEDMIGAINENRKPYISISDSVKAMSVILAIYKSHQEGKAVYFPYGDFSTLEMIGTFSGGKDV